MRKVIVGVMAAVAVAAVAGCSGSSASKDAGVTTESNGATSFRTGIPTKEVDNVNWYTFYRPVLGLVAATWNDYPELMVSANLCESVVREDPDFSIQPGLADFTVNADSTEFEYTIREGAEFWDGSPVTPQDIIFSITTNTTPPLGGQNAALGSEIKSMVPVGTTGVKITLTQPDVIFNEQMAGSAGKVYQEKQAQEAGDQWGSPEKGVMCTGPYKPGTWDPANSLQIVRNDAYWGPDFKPLAKAVTFTWPQDPTTLANGFKSGSIEGGWNIPPSIIAPLQAATDAGQMFVGSADTAMQMYGLVVSDTKAGNLADVNVRQALSKAINRDAIASKVYNGAADPLSVLAPSGAFAYSPEIFSAAAAKVPTTQDVEGAKKLIQDTGKPAPSLVLALPAGDSLATVTATAIQTDASAAGITVTLKPLSPTEYGALFADPTTRKGIDLFFTIYAPVVRDPLVYYKDMVASNGVYNFNGYSNATVDTALAAASAATDPTTRANEIVKAQDEFVKDLPLIPLAGPRVTVWQNAKITGAPTTFTYTSSPWAALLGGK